MNQLYSVLQLIESDRYLNCL